MDRRAVVHALVEIVGQLRLHVVHAPHSLDVYDLHTYIVRVEVLPQRSSWPKVIGQVVRGVVWEVRRRQSEFVIHSRFYFELVFYWLAFVWKVFDRVVECVGFKSPESLGWMRKELMMSILMANLLLKLLVEVGLQIVKSCLRSELWYVHKLIFIFRTEILNWFN